MTYIDPRGKVLAHVDRWVGWQQGDQPAPVTVEWDLSNRCILGCQDCHFAHTHTRGPWTVRPRALPMAYDSTGDLADIDLVIRALADMAQAGVRGVVWSGGGEPLTHPHWEEAVLAADAVGLEQGMYTCGGLLTPISGAVLGSVATWVVISLDAADAQTYAAEKGVSPERFEAACRGVRSLLGGSAVVGVSYLLHAENWRQAPAMLALARRLGATYATFRPAIRTSPAAPSICSDDRQWITAAESMLVDLAQAPDVELHVDRFRAYRDWTTHGYQTCYGIRFSATITPDGRVWLCPQRRGVPASCVGDLRQQAFAALWAQHPGQWTDFAACRVMCRLHPVNETLAAMAAPRVHEAFV